MGFLKSVTLKERHTGLFLLLFTFMLSNYNVYIGFYLKPYMIFLCIFLLFHLSSFSFQKMYSYEIVLILFYLFYVFTGAFSAYPFASIRMMAGIALLIGFYFILKFVLKMYSNFAIQEAIAKSGLLFNAVSLLLYIAGIKKTGLQMTEEMSVSYGVLFDRDYPRLVGLLQDPNLFVFYNSIFFAYFLTNMTTVRNKIGFTLCILTTVLTFSRGGILAMLLIIMIYIVISNSSERWRTMTTIGVIFIPAVYFAIFIMKIDVGALLVGRIEDFSNDGGSGRFELWGRAWEYFLAHPVMGIGADNFIEYNNVHYGENLYTHNTLLQILTESGLLGFVMYFIFLLLVFVQLLKRRLMKHHTYLLLIFIAFLLQIMSLSLIIHEVFILYLAILSITLQREENVQRKNTPQISNAQVTL